MADNRGNIVAPFVVASVNIHDTRLLPESLDRLAEMADLTCLDLNGSYLTLDPGFDSKGNRIEIERLFMTPVIKPNLGRLQDRKRRYKRLDDFERVKHIYHERYNIERCFAWEDNYRKLVIRYEKLQCVFMGFRFLAYSMINFRWFFEERK